MFDELSKRFTLGDDSYFWREHDEMWRRNIPCFFLCHVEDITCRIDERSGLQEYPSEKA